MGCELIQLIVDPSSARNSSNVLESKETLVKFAAAQRLNFSVHAALPDSGTVASSLYFEAALAAYCH